MTCSVEQARTTSEAIGRSGESDVSLCTLESGGMWLWLIWLWQFKARLWSDVGGG